ncbi:hypothetical protein Patl1_30194 [Pistacia atlantica]|uniref:Uncharacterized protein n=1 Tax=Pistacia atlantica TaxID=434234 RepID=A0ACC1AA31_9ROSI|nr:hypothetical protein Patl1_30194 [Pistacia atlantica]
MHPLDSDFIGYVGFLNIFQVSLVTGLFILQNNAVPQSQRGAANGISMTAMSVFKAFGPAGGGVLFSWAQKRQDTAFLPVPSPAKYLHMFC